MNKIEELTKAYQDAGADYLAAQKERTALRDGEPTKGEWSSHRGTPPPHAFTALDLKSEEARDRKWQLARELRPLLMAAEVEAGDADAVVCDPSTVLAQAIEINDDETRAREVLKGINQRREDLARRAQDAAARLSKRRIANDLPQPTVLPPLTDLGRLRANVEGSTETESPYANAVKTARNKHTEALAAAERRRIEAEEEREEQKRIVADRDKRKRAEAAEERERVDASRKAQLEAKAEEQRLAAAYAARNGDAA